MQLGRAAEKGSKLWKSELFLSISEFNSHFREGGGGGVKIEEFVKCEPE